MRPRRVEDAFKLVRVKYKQTDETVQLVVHRHGIHEIMLANFTSKKQKTFSMVYQCAVRAGKNVRAIGNIRTRLR